MLPSSSKISKFLALLCLILIPLQNVFSEIIEIQHFVDIEKYLDKNSLLACDIDDTVFEPTTWVGSDEWFCRELERYIQLGYCRQEALELALGPWTGVQYFITPKLVEDKTDQIIRNLQAKAFPILGLTTRGAGLATRTIEMLKMVNVDFTKSTPVKDTRVVFLNPEVVIYKGGVLFTSGTLKGEALFKLIPNIKELYSKVVFINDKATHLADVEKKCEKEGVVFLGLRYCAADQRKKRHNQAAAKVQFDAMSHVLNNAKAEKLAGAPMSRDEPVD